MEPVSKPKRLIMIGGWTDIYKKANICGISVTLVQEKQKITMEDMEYIDQLYTFQLDDPILPELFALLHAKEPFDCVVSFQEFGLLTAAAIKEKLGLFGNPMEPVLLTRDKHRMRDVMDKHQFPSLPYSIVTSEQDVTGFIRKQGLPVILKPVYGSGSFQIYKISESAQIPQAIKSIKEVYKREEILVEKFIEGKEISVEGFTWDGKHTMIAVTDKFTTGAPHFVETGHNMPSSLPESIQSAARQLAFDFMDLIGHKFGPSHTEIMVSDGHLYIIESHTRTGGDYIFEMVNQVYGFDMFLETLKGFAGINPNTEPASMEAAAAIRYLKLEDGWISRVEGIDSARQIPGVLKCDISLQVGQRVKSFCKSSERNGSVLARGESMEAALNSIHAALNTISIEVSESV
ncbi:ATP-grasp domain-containing protein [Paenibacillus sp. FSL R7-0331]|uniref:ATP-grasp domain-containing protein n=1 Tax=Paenibacillus sp. FSL R7-0331 TaxID=1536773 RepID=UPI000694E51A|nr:ATP-grasp domain-containing protein [Paenibacillus sp. FSL R7-0331]